MSIKNKIAVSFDDVAFSYGNNGVLSNVNFHIHDGEFAALLGPNGAGKTTVISLILGLLKPGSGSVKVYGAEPAQGRHHLGFVPQYAEGDRSFPATVRAVVRMGLLGDRRDTGLQAFRKETPAMRAAVRAAIDRALELGDVRDLENRHYNELSGGQRKRVLLARALVSMPDMLILDEPTANMDTASEKRLFNTLGQLKGNTTVLIVTHDHGFVSSLTDTALCLGEKSADGSSVIRHAVSPALHAPPGLFGGQALKVLHDTDLKDCDNCGDHS